MLQKVNFKRRK